MTKQIRMTNDEVESLEDARDLAALANLSDEEWEEGLLAIAGEVFPDESWDEEAQL